MDMLRRLINYCIIIIIIMRMFIRHKDRQYKIETETDGIKTRLKKRRLSYNIKNKTY